MIDHDRQRPRPVDIEQERDRRVDIRHQPRQSIGRRDENRQRLGGIPTLDLDRCGARAAGCESEAATAVDRIGRNRDHAAVGDQLRGHLDSAGRRRIEENSVIQRERLLGHASSFQERY